jgi:hypothetical protein
LPRQRWIAPQNALRTSSSILVIDESDDSGCKLNEGNQRRYLSPRWWPSATLEQARAAQAHPPRVQVEQMEDVFCATTIVVKKEDLAAVHHRSRHGSRIVY